jgi:flagellar assembly protein FliH
MKTIIKANEPAHSPQAIAFNFDDMTDKAKAYLATVQVEANRIIADAKQQAQAIRQQAEKEGQAAAMKAMEKTTEQKVADQMQSLLPALKKVVADLDQAKQAWLKQWEHQAIRVSAAMAERVIRRELSKQPNITLALVREALELAGGTADVRIYLNPEDHQALGKQAQLLIRELGRAGAAELVANQDIGRGGCRVETQFGQIDQQIATQLARLEEELS